MSELKFKLESDDSKKLSIICGPVNSNLSKIEDSLSIKIKNRGSLFSLSGEDQNITKGRLVIEELFSFADQSKDISPKEIHFFISKALNQPSESRNFKLESKSAFSLTTPKLEVIPRNQSQEDFINSISSHDISFGIGPAGTGKTYLAVAVAVNLFIQRKINKIILTRPLVEAGERLGFLPGDLAQKVDPYLQPLYDALNEMLGFETVNKFIERGNIELAPLAYMRGRTLNDAFLILDEAQNCTSMQMKMFLTRLGFNSKAVVTGDVTQIDLPSKKMSGLADAVKILEGQKGISFFHFASKDVVRHNLVQSIIEAYEKNSKNNED